MDSILRVIILILVVLTACIWLQHNRQRFEAFLDSETTRISPVGSTGTTLQLKPTLWWFVDDETNARSWWDFGARNSTQPNRGYLEIALKAAQATQAFDFKVVPLLGREAVSKVIRESGGDVPPRIRELPAPIWRQWALAALLATKGGLAMVGDSTLCIGPSFGPLTNGVEAAVFGITSDEPRAIPGARVAPASWVGWAARPHTPVWDIAASTWTRLVEAGPTSWSAAEARGIQFKIWATQKLKEPVLYQVQEGSRRTDGIEITREDLLMKTAVPADPKIAMSPETVYVVMDGDALVRDYRYGWFVRMSAEQIFASNFVWAALATKHQSSLWSKSK
jgi:hypothetical protein